MKSHYFTIGTSKEVIKSPKLLEGKTNETLRGKNGFNHDKPLDEATKGENYPVPNSILLSLAMELIEYLLER